MSPVYIVSIFLQYAVKNFNNIDKILMFKEL